MAGRIIVNGRVVVASPGSREEQRARKNELAAKGWADIYALANTEPGADAKGKRAQGEHAIAPLQPLPHPKPVQPVPTFVLDEGSGVRFRVEPKLSMELGWVTAQTIGRWFDVQPHTVHHLARIGLLDAAMEAGTPTRRFRVLDTAKVRGEIARLRAERLAVVERRTALDDPSTGAAILAKMKLRPGAATGKARPNRVKPGRDET